MPGATAQHTAAPVKQEDLNVDLDDAPADFARRTLLVSGRRSTSPVAGSSSAVEVAVSPADEVQIRCEEVESRASDTRLVILNDPDSARAATFRILRHRVAERGNPRTILVTSAAAEEGKTMTAANLALALCECGRARVLLVEANFRRPNLARLFGFNPPMCFFEQLALHREKPLEPWTVAQATSPWLHVLAVDDREYARADVIDGPAFESGLNQLKSVRYDYIVVDTPPVLGSADVNLIQDVVDGVVFACWVRRSSVRLLRRAIDQLTPSKILGTVLLGV